MLQEGHTRTDPNLLARGCPDALPGTLAGKQWVGGSGGVSALPSTPEHAAGPLGEEGAPTDTPAAKGSPARPPLRGTC